MYTISKLVMKEAGLNLRKWNTVSPELLHQIEEVEGCCCDQPDQDDGDKVVEEEQSYESSTGSISRVSSEDYIKLLGSYGTVTHAISFQLLSHAKGLSVTKWSVQKIMAKLFEPLGLLSPSVVRLKILFRSLCTEKVN